MCPDIESAPQRLQTILCELEHCCADDETFSPQLVEEAHTLVRLLHQTGHNMASVRQDDKIIIEIEPMPIDRLAASKLNTERHTVAGSWQARGAESLSEIQSVFGCELSTG
jgi:hypothetical protein